MSNEVQAVNESSTASTATNAQAADPAKTSPSGSSEKSFNSMADLKEKAPDVYQKMLEGIAMTICREMDHHQDRLKKMMREASSR